MNYSFQVRAATKAEAKQKVAEELDREAAAQACHEIDKAQALAAAAAFIDLLEEDATNDVVVTMNGTLLGRWDGGAMASVVSASLSVGAGLAAKQ